MSGSAAHFGERLTEFLANDHSVSGQELWFSMENQVFAQDDIYSASEPTITVLLAALVEESPPGVRLGLIDLLFHLVNGASLGDDALARRCLDRAREGAWLLVREALHGSAVMRESCLEILDLCSPECAVIVRASA